MLIFQRYSWWVAAMVGLALLLAVVGQVGVLSPVQGLFLNVASPFEKVLNGTFRPIAGLLSNAGEVGAIRDENSRLRLENEELRNQIAELQQNAAQIDDLREALNLTQGDKSVQYLAGSIVHRDASPFTDVVTIDRGSGDGLQVGMVVLSTKGTLMGKITKVTKTNAFVRRWKGNLVVDFGSLGRSRELERLFFSRLASLGLPVRIECNLREES